MCGTFGTFGDSFRPCPPPLSWPLRRDLGYLVYPSSQRFFNINLYSPTTGSKKENIHTYKYGEKATKNKNNIKFCSSENIFCKITPYSF